MSKAELGLRTQGALPPTCVLVPGLPALSSVPDDLSSSFPRSDPKQLLCQWRKCGGGPGEGVGVPREPQPSRAGFPKERTGVSGHLQRLTKSQHDVRSQGSQPFLPGRLRMHAPGPSPPERPRLAGLRWGSAFPRAPLPSPLTTAPSEGLPRSPVGLWAKTKRGSTWPSGGGAGTGPPLCASCKLGFSRRVLSGRARRLKFDRPLSSVSPTRRWTLMPALPRTRPRRTPGDCVGTAGETGATLPSGGRLPPKRLATSLVPGRP